MTEFTQKEIESFKQKHGEIFKWTGGGKVAILKKPSRKVLSYATSVAAKDPMKFNELILKDCWVAGDEEIKTDDSLFLGISGKIAELIEVVEGELEKL